MILSVNEPNFWEEHYQQGTPGWDLGEPAPPFVDFLQSSHTLPPGKTAVLGCGRGYEALLFASYGFDVVGIDFATSAIEEALNWQQKLIAQPSLLKGSGQDLPTSAIFLQRDIFELSEEFSGQFDYVVEHTCFCAIPPEKRGNYAQLVESILKPKGQLLGLFFTHSRPGGPPFGITPGEIQAYFQDKFHILDLHPVTNSTSKRQGEEHWGQFRVKKK
ncbi:Thiopurine S-methyltransferase [Planktothrix tepida]|uniref:Similar to thiol methyltransferase 1 n=1 Tax=Planktothrix tepida PCC 9214 TaxID=671072 RepID=A0A1J1LKR0_9CYAN|nr:methyltransferase domain-containing protein [Planktothrix tepida]CAD5951008.1 Thiopurine S-methyltransferase [Planktothrix tepida]CUR32602.1 Similar to thiol methyltransferase 1 [Planktothrix tepida PCC 9214]